MVSPLLPLLLSAAYMGDVHPSRPTSRLLDQDFGLGLQPEQLVFSRYGYYIPRERLLDIYFRPWADLLRPENGGGISSISLDKDQFKVILDVQQFKPEEIEVQIVDKFIVVTAKHEEKKDEHGLISRQFVRRYEIPENVDPKNITSNISTDGVLTIEAPVKEMSEGKNVRKVKIEFTGKPALKHTEDTTTSTTTESTAGQSTTQSSSPKSE
ncbi:protein lethal(2)essential for life-like [Phymastichus coffea]|uniref:protein lethal(2)essential for life-like n=1 Tax=Phymastichus coffea TaxID=108790 RepID=UPI00273B677E|nr:protein lethal(2)essential for life-like [Phymastichus coffea]